MDKLTDKDCDCSIEELYLSHKNMIYKQAKMLSNGNQELMQELIETGGEAFCLAYKTYKPEIGKFSTWFTYHIIDLMNRQKYSYLKYKGKSPTHKSENHYNLTNDINLSNKTDNSLFKFMLCELSKEAKEIVSLVLYSCHEIYSIKSHENGLFKFLREKGWSRKKILKTTKEISELLKNSL